MSVDPFPPSAATAWPVPPVASAPFDLNVKPPITVYEQIIRLADACELLEVSRATLRKYMRGIAGKQQITPLPYVRVGGALYFYKGQIAWWLRQIQEQPDPLMVDVRRALKEGGQ